MDKKTILKILEYSSIAYKNIQPKYNCVKEDTIDDKITDVQCYIRKYKTELYIIFRGTNSKKDWITDFKFWKKTVPYDNMLSKIRVHTGFINAYKSKNVRPKIQSLITDDIERVNVTGHSYGAALATLCAIDLEYNFPEKDYEVILFGSPRVGNRAFKKSYNKRIFKTFRVYNGNDIVTKIPFAFLGYRHVGIGIHVGVPRIFGVFSFHQHGTISYYLSILNSCF